jgi:hypothetical protein
MTNQGNRRRATRYSGDYVVTRSNEVLRIAGKAGAHGQQLRPVPADWAARVIAGLQTAAVAEGKLMGMQK